MTDTDSSLPYGSSLGPLEVLLAYDRRVPWGRRRSPRQVAPSVRPSRARAQGSEGRSIHRPSGRLGGERRRRPWRRAREECSALAGVLRYHCAAES